MKKYEWIHRYINNYNHEISSNGLEIRSNAIIFRKNSAKILACHQIYLNLKTNNEEIISNSLSFLRDLYLSRWLEKCHKKRLMMIIEKSDIYTELKYGLYAKSDAVRSDSIYTIGKLTNGKYSGILGRAFYTHYATIYPLQINSIFFECNWLSKRHTRKMTNFLINSRNPLMRWASLSLDNFLDFALHGVKQQYAQLKFDQIENIRKEYEAKFEAVDVENLVSYEDVSIVVQNLKFYTKDLFNDYCDIESLFFHVANKYREIMNEIRSGLESELTHAEIYGRIVEKMKIQSCA